MATIIKATGPLRMGEAAPLNMDDIGHSARQHLEQARAQAAQILAAAEQEAAVIRRQAVEQGRALALEAANDVLDDKVRSQLVSLAPALGQAIDGIVAAQAEWLRHWEQSAVHLATAIAARIVRREVAHTPEITLSLVREALELAAGSADIHLRMHPDDVAALGPQVRRLANEMSRVGTPRLVADAQIEKGGCRIDTKFGSIDQQFSAQLDRIEQELS